MNRFMLTVTVATAALLGAHNAAAETILYTPPGVTATTAQAVPLGTFIAGRLDDKNVSEFRNWLTASDIKGTIDVSKGYTAFVLVDGDFDPANPENPIEHYIVNGRVPVATMHGDADTATAINGDELMLSRTNESYYVDGKRINGIIKNPEGTIYLIGGPVSAFSL